MRCQHVRIRSIAEALKEVRGALDIGKEERYPSLQIADPVTRSLRMSYVVAWNTKETVLTDHDEGANLTRLYSYYKITGNYLDLHRIGHHHQIILSERPPVITAGQVLRG